ncbi:23S rRNA m(5)U-1939 methyltransferase [Sphingomonas guangdongensis]|uniref:23S rRNA m(5)U-1939 methyltransferase n=1 Tax=Sphingomonas guangdongensis TaxID=1141890 RepID=A0A285R035_9SPHN|nr:class I SAM-dependent RNA methyltransferase [Sphingomonas guangdongensis]SOB87515.1 23S rRNA m(5)U-1939 methyltransferase [Sphingomonas guangdongensis]
MSEVVRIAARGDGVTADGRHVALAAPGDMLRDDGTLQPGPHHRTAPCRHFPACGGCQLQQLDGPSYAGFVRDRVVGALAAQQLVTDVRDAIVSPPRTRRRATLHAERQGRHVRLGFAEQGSHRLIDLAECHVLLPELFALVAPLRTLLAAVLPERSRADVHLARADGGIDVLLRGSVIDGLAAAEAITGFAERQRLARFAVDEGLGAEVRWEPQPATITLGGVPVPLPPGAFLQATADGEAALIAAVREAIGSARTTADLFAGLGTFALALPGRVYAAEGARDSVLALSGVGRARGVFAEHRDLFRRPLVPAELDRFEAVVLDPPRAGAREQVLQLAGSKVSRIAYVSCNPSSFARDAAVLCEGGYQLDWVQPVGQFTWSTHVELAAAFSRPGSPR